MVAAAHQRCMLGLAAGRHKAGLRFPGPALGSRFLRPWPLKYQRTRCCFCQQTFFLLFLVVSLFLRCRYSHLKIELADIDTADIGAHLLPAYDFIEESMAAKRGRAGR